MLSQTLSFALGMTGYLAHCLVKQASVYYDVLVLHAKENIAMLLQNTDGDMKCDMIDDAMKNQKVVESATDRGTRKNQPGTKMNLQFVVSDSQVMSETKKNFPLSDLNYLT